MPDAGEITRLLQQAVDGNLDAANRLFVLVEPDLRRIARGRKRDAQVPAGVDASTTILVDDAFCRLVGNRDNVWQPGDRGKFFAYFSNKVHDFLIDELRKHRAEKRGGGLAHQPLDDDIPDRAGGSLAHLELLLDLKDALLRLQEFAWEDAVLYRIRFFLGCTFEETAEIMGLSKTDTLRRYKRIRLWLKRELKEYELDP